MDPATMEDMLSLMPADTDREPMTKRSIDGPERTTKGTVDTPEHTTKGTVDTPGLLTVPGEIRNEIWRMLLTTRYAFKEPRSEGDRGAHYELQPAILRLNHQIYRETRGILREENMWIVLCIALPKKPFCYVDKVTRLPVVSRDVVRGELNKAKNCYLGMQSHSLNVLLYPDHSLDREDYDCHTLIMGPESLPYLLQLLFVMLYIHRPDPTPSKAMMEMYVGESALFPRSKLQEEILEPFAAARGFGSVFLQGNVDETFAHSMMARMRTPWQSTTEILDRSATYLEKGDAAAAAGLVKAASFYYQQGSDFTFFASRTYIENFYPQSIKSRASFTSMLNAFDVRWATMLLKLRCYTDVQHLVAFMLGRPRRFTMHPTDVIQLVLCCAFASLGLGQTALFDQIVRGLFQGTYDLGMFPTGRNWTKHQDVCEIVPDTLPTVKDQEDLVKNLDRLMEFCKEGEEDSLRRIHVPVRHPGGLDIEFPVAKDWSLNGLRFERRRLTRP